MLAGSSVQLLLFVRSCAAARRALAAGIRRSTCTSAEAATAERRDPLAADPARCFDCPIDPALLLLLQVSDQVECYGLSDM